MNPFKFELIDNHLKTYKISKTKFCQLAKISTNTLNKIYAGNLTVGLKSVFRVAYTLSLNLMEFLN